MSNKRARKRRDDDDDDDDDEESAPASPESPHQPCKCKNSKCLKLYCECFRAQRVCKGCNCKNCHNTNQHAAVRQAAIDTLLEKKPHAFDKKHVAPCNCKKSRCLKKYCDCFNAGKKCGPECKCVACKNGGGDSSHGTTERKRVTKKKRKRRAAEQALFNAPESPRGGGARRRSSRSQRRSYTGDEDDEYEDDEYWEHEEYSRHSEPSTRSKRGRRSSSRRSSAGSSVALEDEVSAPSFLTVPGAGPEFFQRLVRTDCSSFVKRSATPFSKVLISTVKECTTEAEQELAVLQETGLYLERMVEAVRDSSSRAKQISEQNI